MKKIPFSSKVITITPKMAEEFLLKSQKKFGSRGMDRIKYYAQQMKKGLWTMTNDDILFDWYGNLLNGEARLYAIVMSGKSIVFGVKSGLNPSTLSYDKGSKHGIEGYLWHKIKKEKLPLKKLNKN